MLVLRATPSDRDGAVAEMVEDAELSARQYVVEAEPGSREVLYGVSAFAHPSAGGIRVVMDRFAGAPAYVEITIGVVRAAGFQVYPTGTNPDHFDIQLIGGAGEDDPPASTASIREAANRVLAVGSPLRPNPSYSGGTGDFRQEGR